MELPIYENEAPVGTLRVSRQGLYTLFEARLPDPVGEGLAPPADSDARPTTGRAYPQGTQSPAPTVRSVPASVGAGVLDGPPSNSACRTPHSEFPLSRLWLLDGRGAAAPLGLLEPRRDGRLLRRRLTRLDLRALPARPVRALILPAGERPPAPVGADAYPQGTQNPAPTAQSAPVPVGADALGGPQPGGPQTGPVNCPRAVQGPAPTTPPPSSSQNAKLKTENSVSPWVPRPDGTRIDPARRLVALPCALERTPPGLRKITIEGREYLVFRY